MKVELKPKINPKAIDTPEYLYHKIQLILLTYSHIRSVIDGSATVPKNEAARKKLLNIFCHRAYRDIRDISLLIDLFERLKISDLGEVLVSAYENLLEIHIDFKEVKDFWKTLTEEQYDPLFEILVIIKKKAEEKGLKIE